MEKISNTQLLANLAIAAEADDTPVCGCSSTESVKKLNSGRCESQDGRDGTTPADNPVKADVSGLSDDSGRAAKLCRRFGKAGKHEPGESSGFCPSSLKLMHGLVLGEPAGKAVVR